MKLPLPRLDGLCVSLCLFATSAIAVEPQQLTNDGRLKRDPVFISNGEQVVYSVQHDSPQLVLCRLNLRDGRMKRLHPESSLPEFRPCYSADEQALSFLQMTGNDVLQLKVELPTEQRILAIPASKKTVWHAAITSDGQAVVYAAAGQIYSHPIGDGKERQLTQTAGRNNYPAASPDGSRIAFSSSRDGDYEIYTMNRDGSDVRRLTQSRGLDIRPAWSPDGKRIAFTTARHGDYEIYLMRSDGSDAQRITDNPERDDYPAWHPDGKRLVIVSEHEGAFDLFLLPVDS